MANQSQRKYEKLLNKAQELFWRYGYTSVSVDQIAKEAGISKMTIYKYFPSKDDLLISVLENYTQLHIQILMEKLEEKYHTIEKIEVLYSYMLELNHMFTPTLIKDIMDRAHIMQHLTDYKEKTTLTIWRSIIQDGIAKKEIRELDADFVSRLLFYIPVAITKTVDLSDEEKRLKLFHNLFDFLKYGLLGTIAAPKNFGAKGEVQDAAKCFNENRKFE